MNRTPSAGEDAPGASDESVRDTAARWVVRRDRRLSPTESVELETWLAADPRHATEFARSSASWAQFRAIGAAARRRPPQRAAGRVPPVWRALASLAAAAAIMVALLPTRHPLPEFDPSSAAPQVTTALRAPVVRPLPDGSVARLRDGAEIAEAFTAGERRIHLLRGEVYFTVAKDASRPFLVEIGSVTVRAVGTAFAVRFDAESVDVLVTEGVVRVSPPTVIASLPTASAAGVDLRQDESSALVSAGHCAIVARRSVPDLLPVVITAVTPTQVAQRMAWSHPVVELDGATLGELTAAFAARTGHRIEIPDPTLAAVRLGGRFPAHDLDGFVRALAEIYDVATDSQPDGTLVVRRRR